VPRIVTITVLYLIGLSACLILGACEQRDPVDPVGTEGAAIQKDYTDTFLLRAYDTDSVFVTSVYNGWQTADPDWRLTSLGDDYTWRLITEMPGGLFFYKYVLHRDGVETWLTDPAAVEINGTGAPPDPAYWNGVRGRTFTTPQPLAEPPDRTKLVIYEIAPNDFSAIQTFTGIYAGLTSGPNLVDLGVNAIELMPVTAPSYNGWGYDPILYFAPNPSYGWPSTFALMVDAAHSHGIAVILDMVLNHSAGSNPLRQLDDLVGEYNFTTDEPNPWGMVELNWNNPALREHILDALCLWVDRYKVDGFRFDYIGGEPYSTWIWLRQQLEARYPDLLLIAEDFNYPNGGNAVTNGYDAQWGGNHTDGWGGGGNNFNQVMITALTERGFCTRGQTVPSVGAFGFAYRNMWAVANVVGGNDQYAGGVPGDGFSDVKYLESHDENRLVWAVDTYGSAGAQAVGGLTKAHLGAVIQMTTVGIPMLYNGQEIGSGEYRPASPTTYLIDWLNGDADLRAAYKILIDLRLTAPALASENIFFHWRDGLQDHLDMTLCYWRGETGVAADAEIVVAANFDHEDHAWDVQFPSDGLWELLDPVAGTWTEVTVSEGQLYQTIPASTARLWRVFDDVTAVPLGNLPE